MKIEKTFTVYQENGFYSAFPGIANLGGGKLAVAFRRAPNYQDMPGVPEGFYSHGDPMSQYMITYSEDEGNTWCKPKLLYSSPYGGSQDGSLYYDGKYLFANSFIWRYLPDLPGSYMAAIWQKHEFIHRYFTYLVPYGTYVMRSDDRGSSWSDAVFPEPLPDGLEVLPGQPHRLHNRGNILRSQDGRLLLVGQNFRKKNGLVSSVSLYESKDDGASFQFVCDAIDAKGIGIFEYIVICITIIMDNKNKAVGLYDSGLAVCFRIFIVILQSLGAGFFVCRLGEFECGGFFGFFDYSGKRRNKHSGKYGNNRYDNNKFYYCKALAGSHFHSLLLDGG